METTQPRTLRSRLTPALAWDVFMVWVALVNLTLIVFDLSYLQLRPVYLHWAPAVVRIYDPVKGIHPNPITDAMLEEARTLGRLLAHEPGSPAVDAHLARLRELSRRMLEENPFERAGLSRNLEIIKVLVSEDVGKAHPALLPRSAMIAAFDAFWTNDRTLLARHLALFEQRIAPLLEVNYARDYDLDGHLEDHFWRIDLPFLVLFWLEFGVRWLLAMRRDTYPRWFFFPLANWYDLLGLVPSREFRVFRLIRVVSIYIRLRRSEHSAVGHDIISRTVAYVAGIIAEEISDMVAIRILSELEEEIRGGTHLEILGETLDHRRAEIESTLVAQIGDTLAADETRERARELYAVALARATERDGPLGSIPLPGAVVRPLVRAIGDAVFSAVMDTASGTLASEEGRAAADRLASALVDDVFRGVGLDQLEHLGRDVVLEILERMKAAVAVKKWAQRPEDVAAENPPEGSAAGEE